MSKKPYIIQQDSPNLVIVPTDSTETYEPSPKKVKLVSAPIPTNYNTVFSKKTSAKLNFNGRNDDVLIDVTKVRSPASWATNFLESIGGSSTKFTKAVPSTKEHVTCPIYSAWPGAKMKIHSPKNFHCATEAVKSERKMIYSSLPKSPLSLRKNYSQPQHNTEITLSETTQITNQPENNTQSSMEENTSAPKKVNMELIKSALQSSKTKKTNQPKSKTHYYQPICNTSPSPLNKEPSLPKNYKIPIKPLKDKETTTPLSTNNICLKSQTSIASKSNSDILQLKHRTPTTIQDTTANKANHPDHKESNPLKHTLTKNIQHEKHREKTMISDKLTKKIKIRQSSEKHSSKEENQHSSKSNIETTKPKRNKENSLPKNSKDIAQGRTAKETTLPKSYKDPCPPCIKIKDIITKSNRTKESHKNRNIHQSTFSTKLKTKKDHLTVKSNKTSKTTKHSQEKVFKNHEDKSEQEKSDLCESKKEDPIPKLKKKRDTENNLRMEECSDTKNKKLTKSDANSQIITKEMSTSSNEDRLSKSISPIKSVVSKIKTDFQSHTSEKHYHKESSYHHSHFENHSRSDSDYHSKNPEKSLHRSSAVDLRTKLKRRVTKNNEYKKHRNRDHLKKKNTFATVAKGNPFVPEDNLIISFNTEEEPSPEESKEENVTMKKSPVKKLVRKQPSGGSKCKKIKLEINIVFGQTDTTDDESTKSNDEANDEPLENTDLSFLDDFNVDEIVQSLNECKDCSRNSHTEEHLADFDINAQGILSSASKKVVPMDVDDKELLNKIGTDKEIPFKEIFPVEKKIEKHQEIALQPTVDEKYSCCHQEEIQIKKEKEIGIEANTELSQTANIQDSNVRISYPEVQKTDTRLESAPLIQNKNSIMDKTQPNTNEIKIADTKSVTNDNCTLLAPKMDISEEADNAANIEDVKPAIASSEITEANLNSGHVCSSDDKRIADTLPEVSHKESMNNHLEIVKEESTENETLMPQDSSILKKVETHVVSTQNVNEIPTRVKEESEVILIEDSESETETEDHRIKSKNTSNVKTINESPLNDSDDVVFIESTTAVKSEPIIILDTDIDTKENSNKISQSILANKNATSESKSRNLVEQKSEIKIDNEVKPDNAALQHTSGEVKTEASAETDVEEAKTQQSKNENNNLSNVKIPIELESDMEVKPDKATTDTSSKTKSENEKTQDATQVQQEKEKMLNVKVVKETNSKLPQKPSNEKPGETNTDKKSPSKQAAVDTKMQNVNTRLEAKSPNQNNSQNITKSNEETEVKVSHYIANSKYLQQLESRLCNMGNKCTIAEMKRQGKFSTIYICKDSSKREFALKLLRKQCDGYNLGLQTEKMMMKLQKGVPENNLNCVRLINGFIHSGIWCFLMEYYPRNLQEALLENQRSFHIDTVQVLSRQLVSAVTILRNNNIIHSDYMQYLLCLLLDLLKTASVPSYLDIKPSHILINAAQTRLKLCGFDQACYLERSNLLPNTGTVNYRAPELILGHPAGYGIDVWSTALVMYEMATNQPLFPGFYNNNILYQHLSVLGNIPLEMLNASNFRNAHFRGTSFMRKTEYGESYIIDNFVPNGKLSSVLFSTYAREWAPGRSLASKRSDRANLNTFVGLLRSMLVVHPRYRIAIEFVFANPFIYECFDSDY